jgi:hypothetical protein
MHIPVFHSLATLVNYTSLIPDLLSLCSRERIRQCYLIQQVYSVLVHPLVL